MLYIFTTGNKSIAGFSKFKSQFDEVCGVTGWTLHDLRRTFRTNDAPVRFDGYGAEIDLDPKQKALQVEVIVDDPGAFTMPWSGLVTYQPENIWPEMVCAENTLELSGPPRKVPVADKPDF